MSNALPESFKEMFKIATGVVNFSFDPADRLRPAGDPATRRDVIRCGGRDFMAPDD